ncbi:helix-turn-helix transcriptional regulator [Bordetella genomosp. 2]|uniref:AraC family transcriptional regulator n=1 Tax=Bordetella genomosp. 2 TaxID=1983456 RepID=A0A261VRG7_9BORD|nr:AraC family transcriptional regulator [Bordetella genomosp. 2]OZI76704.1 AraC family transcriptional regulator [Bordetella genomosp. 2]
MTSAFPEIGSSPRRAAQLYVPALREQARHGTAQYAVVAPGTQRPVFEGLVHTVPLADGLILHRVDARDLQGVAVHAVLRPGLRVALTIGGKADVSFGRHRLLLGPRPGGGASGALVAVVEPTAFVRQSRRGDIERTVSLTFGADWLRRRFGDDAGHPCLAFAGRHLALCPWQASAQAVALVEQMLAPPDLDPALWRLYQESRALDLAVEAFACLGGGAPVRMGAGLGRRERARMEQVRELLDSGQADDFTLEQIARHACVSVNTLQRHFRAAWGTTVFAYLRDARLARARLALEREAVSVAQAAWIAGYSSPENFATAFRRRYGVPPGRVGRLR